jgi:hypothetical protein
MMKRRNFIKASLLSSSIASIFPQAGMANVNGDMQKPNQEFYELRTYSLKKRPATEDGRRLSAECCYPGVK